MKHTQCTAQRFFSFSLLPFPFLFHNSLILPSPPKDFGICNLESIRFFEKQPWNYVRNKFGKKKKSLISIWQKKVKNLWKYYLGALINSFSVRKLDRVFINPLYKLELFLKRIICSHCYIDQNSRWIRFPELWFFTFSVAAINILH